MAPALRAGTQPPGLAARMAHRPPGTLPRHHHPSPAGPCAAVPSPDGGDEGGGRKVIRFKRDAPPPPKLGTFREKMRLRRQQAEVGRQLRPRAPRKEENTMKLTLVFSFPHAVYTMFFCYLGS